MSGDGPCPAPSLFRRRLFAISSVSRRLGRCGGLPSARRRRPLGAPALHAGSPFGPLFQARPSELARLPAKIPGRGFPVAGDRRAEVSRRRRLRRGSVGPCVWPDRGRRIDSPWPTPHPGFTGQPEGGCAADRRARHDAPLASLSRRSRAPSPGAVPLADEFGSACFATGSKACRSSWRLPKPVQQYPTTSSKCPSATASGRWCAPISTPTPPRSSASARSWPAAISPRCASSASPRSPIKTASCPSCITARGLAGRNFSRIRQTELRSDHAHHPRFRQRDLMSPGPAPRDPRGRKLARRQFADAGRGRLHQAFARSRAAEPGADVGDRNRRAGSIACATPSASPCRCRAGIATASSPPIRSPSSSRPRRC